MLYYSLSLLLNAEVDNEVTRSRWPLKFSAIMKQIRRKKKSITAKLEEILTRIKQDQSRWHFRRSLFMNKFIPQNLIPNLIYGKENRRLIGTTIKILQELMTPIECLMPPESASINGENLIISLELENAITSSKKFFLDTRVTKALVEFIDSILQTKNMSLNDCEMINHCLILIRNLFHVQRTSYSNDSPNVKPRKPTKKGKSESLDEPLHQRDLKSQSYNIRSSVSDSGSKNSKDQEIKMEILIEDQIMWNLFAQRFDNTLIKLLTCEQQHLWNVTMVQLVSLMYREQHQATISKLIHEWLELSLCESSTDDENNTLSSSSYDAVSTSDPVSDSSERLFPVEGGRCSKVKPNTNILVSDKIFSSNSQCLNTTSSKDSGFGRSSSNNEGETSVDESIQEWATNQHENKDNKLGNECIPSVFNNSKGINKNKIEYPSSVQHIKCKMEAVDIEDAYSEETLKQIRSVFDTGGNDSNDLTQSININNKINFSENLNEFVKTEESAILEEYKNANSQVRGKTKKPPDENESYSGDSSEKPPPHPLPKLAKGKILLPGQKRSRHCMSQKMMNEKQEMQDLSNSTGSDCDDGPHAKRPTHQKPHKMLVKPRPSKLIQKALQERNMKRTKIMKRKESGGMKAKALLHHQPTPEDISNLLKEFTLDFMLNGYATLVQGLRMQVLLPFQMQLDKSHLLWLITYFLRFAVELDLELSQICPVLSVEIVSYLVYEGVVMQEELEIAIRTGVENILPYVRRLHLVVTALREFFISFDVCLKKDPFTVDSKQLTNIKDDICNLVELRQIFVFLIRMYRPGVLTLNYLEDLITTNHRFLTIQEPSESSEAAFDMIAHIKQFATMDIMRQYGRILENFNKNSEMVNDCIFTMMHHIAGELRAVNVLLQPSILKVFLLIWKEGYELCVDWADLIEYVLRKCTKKRAKSSNSMDCVTIGKSEDIQLTIEDVDQLSTLYSSFNEQDLLEKIKDICCDDSLEKPIKKEVIQKLLARGYISSIECTKLCAEIPQPESSCTENKGKKRPYSEFSNKVSPIRKTTTEYTDSEEMLYVSDIEQAIRDQETFETESIHESKKFCSNQDHIENMEREHLMQSKYLDHKLEASSLKTLGSSMEATINSEDMKEEENEKHWNDQIVIDQLIEQIRLQGLDTHLRWLQTEILEACHAKMKIMNANLPFPEPLFFHFAISSQSIPIVPWTSDQEQAITSPFFTQLLGVLGFHLSEESGKIFPRIPNFWGPEILYEVAHKLGSLENGKSKFPLKYMTEMINQLRMRNFYFSKNQIGEYYEDRCDEICDLNSSFDCDDSPERVSDCSMQNNRSVSTSPISSLEDERISPLREVVRPLDKKNNSSSDRKEESSMQIKDELSSDHEERNETNCSPFGEEL